MECFKDKQQTHHLRHAGRIQLIRFMLGIDHFAGCVLDQICRFGTRCEILRILSRLLFCFVILCVNLLGKQTHAKTYTQTQYNKFFHLHLPH